MTLPHVFFLFDHKERLIFKPVSTCLHLTDCEQTIHFKQKHDRQVTSLQLFSDTNSSRAKNARACASFWPDDISETFCAEIESKADG